MKRHLVATVLILLCVIGSLSLAQTPIEVPVVPAALKEASPETLKDVAVWLEVIKVAQQFATTQCQQLESVKQLTRLRAEYQKKIETRLPGYTVNWNTWELVPKLQK